MDAGATLELRYFAIDDRPVEVAGDTIRVLCLTSGALVPGAVLRSRIDEPDRGVELIDAGAFDELVEALRRAISHDRQVATIVWAATSDPAIAYRANHDDVTYDIRIGDFPAEALYTLLAHGQEVDRLDTWPSAWKKP